jgi:hypothetical protein
MKIGGVAPSIWASALDGGERSVSNLACFQSDDSHIYLVRRRLGESQTQFRHWRIRKDEMLLLDMEHWPSNP